MGSTFPVVQDRQQKFRSRTTVEMTVNIIAVPGAAEARAWNGGRGEPYFPSLSGAFWAPLFSPLRSIAAFAADRRRGSLEANPERRWAQPQSSLYCRFRGRPSDGVRFKRTPRDGWRSHKKSRPIS